MDYQAAITEARQLVKRSEEDQWRLAELSWEQVQAGKTRRQWGKDIGVSETYVRVLVQIWAKWGEAAERRTTFRDAYDTIHPHGSRSKDLRKLSSEEKIEMVGALLDDSRVLENVQHRLSARGPTVFDNYHMRAQQETARHAPSEPISDFASPTWEALDDIAIAASSLRRAVKTATQREAGPTVDSVRGTVEGYIKEIRMACEFLEQTIAGGISDADLHAWIES